MNTHVKTPEPELVWPAHINDLPKEVFVRPDIFESELEKIFYGPFWHPIAHEAELPNKGDFKTFDLGRVPLLVARGDDDKIRVFINACAHRGSQVEKEPCGNAKHFECPYHRWIYDNSGDLKVCPSSDDFAPNFKQEEYGLKEVRTEEVFGLIFVTLSDDPPDFETFLGRAKDTLAHQIGSNDGLKFLGYQKVQYASNWKAYADNDGYHAPLLHTGFRLLGWQGGSGEQWQCDYGHSGIDSQLTPGKSAGVLNDPSLIDFRDAKWDSGSFVTGFFPFVIVTKHMDTINIRFAIPRAVDRTEVHYAYFALNSDDEDMVEHRVHQSSNLLGPCGMISMEDAAIFHRVQVGSHSPGNVSFQKGVKNLHAFDFEYKQNDEVANMVRWEHYRKLMGFPREGEAA